MPLQRRSLLAVFVGLAVLTSIPAHAQRRNATGHLTGARAKEVARKTFEASVDGRVTDRRDRCIAAFGNRVFCDCLSAALPLDMDFQRYITVTTVNRDTVRPSASNQQLRDVVLAIRDQCVAAAFGRP